MPYLICSDDSLKRLRSEKSAFGFLVAGPDDMLKEALRLVEAISFHRRFGSCLSSGRAVSEACERAEA